MTTYYREGHAIDSAHAIEIHGIKLPAGFFDNPDARKEWGVVEAAPNTIIHPEIIVGAVNIPEIVLEPADEELVLEPVAIAPVKTRKTPTTKKGKV